MSNPERVTSRWAAKVAVTAAIDRQVWTLPIESKCEAALLVQKAAREVVIEGESRIREQRMFAERLLKLAGLCQRIAEDLDLEKHL